MAEFEIEVSPMIEGDKAFIFSTWLRCFRHCSYFAKRIKNHIFFKWHHELVQRALDRETTTTLVAHQKGDRDLICGYISFEDWDDYYVLHFVYVKGDYQKHGIGKILLDASEIDMDTAFFSHWTFATDELIKKYPNLTYSPYHI